MTCRQNCGAFASISIDFPPKNAQEELYGKKKKQRRLLRYQNYLDCWIDGHSSFTRCGLNVTYLRLASAYIPLSCSFGNYTFIGMDINPKMKRF